MKCLKLLPAKKQVFTSTLDKKHSRVMLKVNKDYFNQEIDALRTKLIEHAEKVENKLQTAIDDSIAKIANYYMPTVKANPPQNMISGMGDVGDKNQPVINWITQQLKNGFLKVESIVKKIELSVKYKDVTFENLNNAELSIAIKSHFQM